jgi:uncharacterized MAPEG superfamily protein
MLFWILCVLALYLVNIYGTAVAFLPSLGVSGHVGPRDSMPEKPRLVGRSQRAADNLKENLPFFLTFALLSFVIAQTDQTLAENGAKVFLVARILYLLAYIWGVPWVRSLVFGVSFIGLAMMLMAIL